MSFTALLHAQAGEKTLDIFRIAFKFNCLNSKSHSYFLGKFKSQPLTLLYYVLALAYSALDEMQINYAYLFYYSNKRGPAGFEI